MVRKRRREPTPEKEPESLNDWVEQRPPPAPPTFACPPALCCHEQEVLFLCGTTPSMLATYIDSSCTCQSFLESVSVLVAQSCPTLMDCSPPGSSVRGISQARILEWVAISFSRGIFLTQGSNPGLPHCRQTHLSHRGSSSFKPHSRYYQLIITLSGLPLLPRQFQALPQGFQGTWKEPL